jgi:serine/threonine protein kinase
MSNYFRDPSINDTLLKKGYAFVKTLEEALLLGYIDVCTKGGEMCVIKTALKSTFKQKTIMRRDVGYIVRQETPMREVDILQKIKDIPNGDSHQIVHLIESFEDKNYLYIVMEHLDGKDLYDVISEDNISHDTTFEIFRQMLTIIEYIHSIGVAHLDISLENFMVIKKGFKYRVVLIDFGLAVYTSEGPFFASDGYRPGKGTNIAPEIAFGEGIQEFDAKKADIWSLGTILYTMLTKIPFCRKPGDKYYNWMMKKLPKTLKIRGIPDEVNALIVMMLRYKSNRVTIGEVSLCFHKSVVFPLVRTALDLPERLVDVIIKYIS